MAKKKAKPAKAKKAAKKKSAPKKSAAKKKSPAKIKRPAAKKAAKSKVALPKPVFGASSRKEVLLGEVEDYFAKIGVIALTLKQPLAVGDSVHVKGHTTDITQPCASMQIEHESVRAAKKGDGIGLKVENRCRKGDKVFRVL